MSASRKEERGGKRMVLRFKKLEDRRASRKEEGKEKKGWASFWGLVEKGKIKGKRWAEIKGKKRGNKDPRVSWRLVGGGPSRKGRSDSLNQFLRKAGCLIKTPACLGEKGRKEKKRPVLKERGEREFGHQKEKEREERTIASLGGNPEGKRKRKVLYNRGRRRKKTSNRTESQDVPHWRGKFCLHRNNALVNRWGGRKHSDKKER